MIKWFWVSSIVGIAVVIVGLSGSAAAEPPPRAPLDALWKQYMLEGTYVVSKIEGEQITSVEVKPESAEPRDNQRLQLIYSPVLSHPISIMKLGEGLFRNGGWVLDGGLLSRARDGPSTYDLYGKAVVRQYSYFPFPPHRDTPQEIGYEFFLLHRNAGAPRPTVLRKWTFQPDEVISKNPHYPWVRALLRYEVTTRSATVTITGLKRPFEEHVDLSSEIEPASRK